MTRSHRTEGPAAPNRWWSDKWAWRGAIAAAPLGALLAIVYALVVLRLAPTEALLAYLLGAAVASGIGCVLAGPLGAAVETLRYQRGWSEDDDAYPDEPAAQATAEPAANEDETVEDDRPAVNVDGDDRTYAGAA